jgi:hypothetical protein
MTVASPPRAVGIAQGPGAFGELSRPDLSGGFRNLIFAGWVAQSRHDGLDKLNVETRVPAASRRSARPSG